MTTPFWINNPSILLHKDSINQLWPTKQMRTEEKLNAITRLVVVLTVLGYLITKTTKIVITGIITIASIVFLYKVQTTSSPPTKNLKKSEMMEAFTNPETYKKFKHNFTEPAVSNPVMNVLMTEYSDNPTRKEAAPSFNPLVEKNINEKTKQFITDNFAKDGDDKVSAAAIDEKLFKGLGDSFAFDQSMRTWYATPNTTVPNDQKSFAEYCYGGMVSCKEGNEFACTRKSPLQYNNM